MSYPYQSSYEDWEAHAVLRCECGRRAVEDRRCDICNGKAVEVEEAVRAANKTAWQKFYREHPEFSR